MTKYIVNVQRPAFESVDLIVEADDESHAWRKALDLAYHAPNDRWKTDDLFPTLPSQYVVTNLDIVK